MNIDVNDGRLPNGWKSIALKDVANVITGRTPSTNDASFWQGEIPFITPVELQGTTVTTTNRHITQKALDICKALPKETVLVSCIGYIGKVGISSNETSVTNQQINAVLPKGGCSDSWFLLYLFQEYKSKLNRLASITTLPIINKSNFEQLTITLPPLREQKAIAHVLRSVQKSKEIRQTELSLASEEKRALMDFLFFNGMRDERRKQTIIGEMPESWDVVALGEMITLQRGRDLPLQDRVEGKIPIVGSNGIVGFHNQAADMPIPCVATGRSGSIGLLTYLDEPYWALNTALYISDFKGNDPLFIYYWLQLFDFKRYAEGVSVPTLNRNKVHPVNFRRPKVEEQKDIAMLLKACDDTISALDNEIKLHDEFFKASFS